MLEYRAPVDDIGFLLNDVFKVQDLWATIPQFADFPEDLVDAICQEAGRLASEVMAPINVSGDESGCTFADGTVTTPPGFKEAYRGLAEGGWIGVSGNPDYEGQGMPKMLSCVLEEMFWAANPSLYLYGTLTVGAAICIETHGSEQQKAQYLPRMYSGEWSGAMALTEAHAGTDLGIMRTRAEPNADGSYNITGTKTFITSGEHDLAENIVHLVLAKLPDAPSGSRGISLFIVPKYLPDANGGVGERNGFASGSIEHKMGIRGSATSVMNYDGATGFLVGEENQGLACMFTMMNYERLSVGIQGLGATELAYQQAARYARERLQGRSATGPKNPDGPADSLLVHPDVRRMLLTIRAYSEAGRAFALYTGMQLDMAKHLGDEDAQAFSELLTPVTKAFMTDRGLDCAVLAQQVFGGHGYIKEWGVEQIVRDVRIAQIYEGTNGVQANDLVGRKVLRDGGATLRKLVDSLSQNELPDRYQAAVNAGFDRLVRVTGSIVERSPEDPELGGAVSADFLELMGLTLYAWFWARMAQAAKGTRFESDKTMVADYFFARLLPKAVALECSIETSSDSVMAMADERF